MRAKDTVTPHFAYGKRTSMLTEYSTTLGYLGGLAILASILACVVGLTNAVKEYSKISCVSSFVGLVSSMVYLAVLVFTVIPSGVYSVPVSIYYENDDTGYTETSIAIAGIYVSPQDCYIETITLADGSTYKVVQDGWIHPYEESRVQIFSDENSYIVATVPELTKETLGVTASDALSADAGWTNWAYIAMAADVLVFIRSMMFTKNKNTPEP